MEKNISDANIKLLAKKASSLIFANNTKSAVKTLKPLLDAKCPFAKLDLLGKEIGRAGANHSQKFFKAFDEIIDYNAMGGFVVVGQALIQFLENNFEKVMQKSRDYIIKGDKWYVCDIIGERSLGQSLVDCFGKALPWSEKFLKDENKWVKRSIGTAIHFFSKRVLDEPEKTKKLLKLIEPHIEERQIDVAKGIGWGLKTIGKYHPEILVKFLEKQSKSGRKISRLMLKKALTYLKTRDKQITPHKNMTGKNSLKEVLKELKSKAKPENLEGMARYGMKGEKRLGTAIPELRKIAKKIGKDHILALRLWKTKIPEAMMLAAMVDDPQKTTKEQIEEWMKNIESWDVCDQLCMNLLEKVPFALKKIKKWSERKEEFVKRTAFALIACLAWHNKQDSDEFFIGFFPIIKNGSLDDRNLVKKAVNWSLRNIGKRNLNLNKEAINLAKEIQQIDSKSARWIAMDAIRELESEAVQNRLID